MIRGAFISSSSTSAGKTFLTRGLARSLLRAGRHPLAIKPAETGVAGDPLDAVALARACSRPELATARGLVRATLPLAPYAVALEAGAPAPQVAELVDAIGALACDGEPLLIEGAGGLLVPINARETMAELALALGLPLLLIAPDRLGVLSDVLACVEAARTRHLELLGVILGRHGSSDSDPSPRTNRRILAERLECPVLTFPACADDDDALADAADACGIRALLERAQAR